MDRCSRSVKVFTINQESRYLLVHGVPDINITDELLKLLSLYGVIEEYDTLDGDSTAEKFTKTHLIKYADIQAARVAKRKMDDHSFYGGFLLVTYAPEYESIQDTREKLQHRRMNVARRLRKFAQERASDVDDGIETVGAVSITKATNDTHPDKHSTITAWVSTQPSQHTCHDPPSVPAEGEFEPSSGRSINEHGTPDQGIPQVPPSLPEPPRRLPAWQWNIPSPPEFPRLRSKHDTLPAGFNPFPEGNSHLNQDRMGNPHQTPPSVPALSTCSFIGPLRPSQGDSLNPDTVSPLPHEQRYSESGARPKERFTSSKHTSGHHESLEQRTDFQQNGKVVDKQSVQTDQCQVFGSQGGHRHADSHRSEGDHRPKLVGRRRIGPNRSSNSEKQINGRQRNIEHPSSLTSQCAFLPRPVSTRAKRSASSVEEDEQQLESGHQSSPTTGDTSFDQTVSTVRQQMFQVSQAGLNGTAPSSIIQTAIIQARNRERMGLLPHRPPTKRQRI